MDKLKESSNKFLRIWKLEYETIDKRSREESKDK
jgi:hypothetical protein